VTICCRYSGACSFHVRLPLPLILNCTSYSQPFRSLLPAALRSASWRQFRIHEVQCAYFTPRSRAVYPFDCLTYIDGFDNLYYVTQITVMNAASIFGRTVPNFVADYYGPLNGASLPHGLGVVRARQKANVIIRFILRSYHTIGPDFRGHDLRDVWCHQRRGRDCICGVLWVLHWWMCVSPMIRPSLHAVLIFLLSRRL
jgi:hypothetical protein